MQAQTAVQNRFINSVMQGDCIQVMRQMPANSVDFILTDPPYLVNYRDRSGRSIQNDVNADWLKPAMREAYRVLKMNRVAVMFYGWTKVDTFFAAWKEAGFQPVGHIVFRKTYSSKSRFLSYQHEQAFLLAKGRPPLPKQPLADVMDMPYSGNELHPTQKPVEALAPLVRSFTLQGELVLDPFAGSGSSCAAANPFVESPACSARLRQPLPSIHESGDGAVLMDGSAAPRSTHKEPWGRGVHRSVCSRTPQSHKQS
ncbi:MAG: DNA methyltransferase [Terracidiphilus sp.]|jgi:site-specific DNA-methyltransferase (adenine-specific)